MESHGIVGRHVNQGDETCVVIYFYVQRRVDLDVQAPLGSQEADIPTCCDGSGCCISRPVTSFLRSLRIAK